MVPCRFDARRHQHWPWSLHAGFRLVSGDALRCTSKAMPMHSTFSALQVGFSPYKPPTPPASLPLQVGFTLHSVTMFGMARTKPVFIAGGGTPARLEMWELQGVKPAQRLILPDAAANSTSFVSSVACAGYQVVACSGTKVYQWNVR